MPKYNKGTKRFITVLEKSIPYLTDVLREKLIENAIDNKKAYIAKLVEQGMSKQLANECANNIISHNTDKYINSEKNSVGTIGFMTNTLRILKGQEIFYDLEKLDFIFDYLNIPEIFQIDVLAYILKNNIRGFKNSAQFIKSKEDKYEGEELDYAEILKEEIEIMSNMYDDISKEEMEKAMSGKNFKDIKDSIHEAYVSLEEYVDDSYQFVASFDLDKLFKALIQTGANWTSRQLKLIVYAVSEKQLEQLFVEKKESNKPKEPEEPKKEHKNIQSITDLEKIRKEQNNAKQQLKRFLESDYPVIYIDDIELTEVISLLKKAGYTSKEINSIRKNILENNAKLEQEEMVKIIIANKQQYLSIEEMEVLEKVEDLMSNQDSYINPLFIEIKENYEFVNEMLLKLEAEDQESIELIHVAIQEIQETIINYQYSDYRYSLELKNSDNN